MLLKCYSDKHFQYICAKVFKSDILAYILENFGVSLGVYVGWVAFAPGAIEIIN